MVTPFFLLGEESAVAAAEWLNEKSEALQSLFAEFDENLRAVYSSHQDALDKLSEKQALERIRVPEYVDPKIR